MVAIPIGNVVSPRHLELYAYTDPLSTTRVRTETYTGWIAINFSGASASTRRDEITSYLPVAATTINSYETASQILDVTVTAAPSSVADDDDEANVAAVDSASVSLRPQTLPGVSGSPLCLVFRARVAAHKATIHAITYQVAIQSRIGGEGNGTLQRLNLARTQTPQ